MTYDQRRAVQRALDDHHSMLMTRISDCVVEEIRAHYEHELRNNRAAQQAISMRECAA
ncbi:hypothetical protein [Komagataeibacter phage phiKX1]|nr:hypothetical protein [Komagataeibacter phage phiKX1]BCZ76185.1 hypothetical protein [Komagataeibacter phage phiKX2]